MYTYTYIYMGKKKYLQHCITLKHFKYLFNVCTVYYWLVHFYISSASMHIKSHTLFPFNWRFFRVWHYFETYHNYQHVSTRTLPWPHSSRHFVCLCIVIHNPAYKLTNDNFCSPLLKIHCLIVLKLVFICSFVSFTHFSIGPDSHVYASSWQTIKKGGAYAEDNAAPSKGVRPIKIPPPDDFREMYNVVTELHRVCYNHNKLYENWKRKTYMTHRYLFAKLVCSHRDYQWSFSFAFFVS